MYDPLSEDDFFEPPERYQPSDEYYAHVVGLRPATWRLNRGHTWTQLIAPRRSYRTQGWKIHVSCCLDQALPMLTAVLARCCARNTEFKFASDSMVHRSLMSKNISRATGGKFITIYPNDDAGFEALLAELHADLRDFAGPYILSDRQYLDSKVIFYRYGGFSAFTETDVFGDRKSLILDGEYRHFEDERTAGVIVPEFAVDKQWGQIPDDADADADTSAEAPLMNGRYRMTVAMKHSNVGGVYLAEDLTTGNEVIVREARPHTAPDIYGTDAVARLEREYQILRRLAATGAGPQPIELFTEWDHHFLVLEKIEGVTLRQFVATRSKVILAASAQRDVGRWLEEAFQVAANLVGVVKRIHDGGVIFGDISSNNIIVEPESLKVALIDFETAFVPRAGHGDGHGDGQGGNAFTPGFGSRARERRADATLDDDLFSLGCALVALLVPSYVNIAIIPDLAARAFQHLEQDFRLPRAYAAIVASLLAPSTPPDLAEIAACLANLRVEPAPSPASPTVELQGHAAALNLLIDLNLHVIDLAHAWRPLPFDPHGSGPMAFDHGMLGAAYALRILRPASAGPLVAWAKQHADDDFMLPGLLRGAAGMSWLLTAAGEPELGRRVLERLADHPLLYHDHSLGYGLAGVGLCHLKLWQASGATRDLEAAVAIANILVDARVATAAGCTWGAADTVRLGLHAGGIGTALFLLYIAVATSEPRFAHVANAAIHEELLHGREHGGMLGFPSEARAEGPQDSIIYPYLATGTAGVGHVLLRAQRVNALLQLDVDFSSQLATCRATSVSKYASLAGLGMGLAGLGNFLLDVHQLTGDASALADAAYVADGLDLFKVHRAEGLAFPTSSRAKVSVSYLDGSSGIGLFLHRLVHGAPSFHFTADELFARPGAYP